MRVTFEVNTGGTIILKPDPFGKWLIISDSPEAIIIPEPIAGIDIIKFDKKYNHEQQTNQ